MDTNTINALKRLERAGSESSRATEKLIEAVDTVAARVTEIITETTNNTEGQIKLPRDYEYVYHAPCTSSDYTTLARYTSEVERYCGEEEHRTELLYSSRSGYPYGDVVCPRALALQFAADIAAGWLDELADWLEQRRAADEQATQTLEPAADKLGA